MQPSQELATRLIDRLVEFRADLRDETKQAETIMFIKFGLKDPRELDPTARQVLGGARTAGRYPQAGPKVCQYALPS